MRRLTIAILAAAWLLPVVSCSDNDDAIESQRTTIVRYLSSTHVPTLVSAEDAAESLDPEPAFYDMIGQDVYRYIATYYDAGRDTRPEVEWGDEVELTYTAYVFSGGVPRAESVYSSNDAEVIAELVDAGLNAEYWTTDPLRVRLGATDIIKGVTLSLEGCREGDRVEAYMTLEAAYGDDVIGVVPKESSVVWIYTIDSVTKSAASGLGPVRVSGMRSE